MKHKWRLEDRLAIMWAQATIPYHVCLGHHTIPYHVCPGHHNIPHVPRPPYHTMCVQATIPDEEVDEMLEEYR